MATSFKQITAVDNNNLLIVDALNLAFRWKHKGAKVFAEDYIATVKSLQKSYKAGKVIIACDKGSSTYRKNIYPQYKANRQEKYDKQTPEEAEYFEVFMAEFNRTMDLIEESSEFLLLRFKGREADDIAAYIVGKCKKTHTIWLASSDEDWDLLVGPTVSRFSYVTRKEITFDNWGEHYAYGPDDHISIKCLTGDSGDNIPGVKGIGPVKAAALVREYGSTYDIIASIPIASKYKHIASLNDFGAEALILNYKLMDLVSHCDEALGPEVCKTIDDELGVFLED